MPDRPPPPTVAAVDLGSNSFHMVVARVVGRDFQVLDRVKHPVRLAAGLDARGKLTVAAQHRALDCLAAFGERVADLPLGSVRAVGTNSLRKAHNTLPFLVRASAALGHPIEVISGREEARLIYLGVCRELHAPGRRLVVDIGGGSTELIIGEGEEPLLLDSLTMGCVSWSTRFFPEGDIKREGMKRAMTAANLELETVADQYRGAGFESAVGSSGTILAVERILIESGLSPEGITVPGLKKLRAALITAGRMGAVRLPGLQRDRRAVLPGGVALLSAVMESLGISRMSTSPSALREGVLVDLLGRFRHEDVREHAISELAGRFGVELSQAARVSATALELFDQVSKPWGLDPERHRELLGWAAIVHEVGLFIAWPSHHKHGAYILAHADLPGFSRPEQEALAALVLGHRGKLDAERVKATAPSPPPELDRLMVLLRLSCRLHRSRAPRPLPPLSLSVVGNGLSLNFPEGFLAERPLTLADLREEAEMLAPAGFVLQFS